MSEQKNLYEFYDMKSSSSKKSIQTGVGRNIGYSKSDAATKGESSSKASNSSTKNDSTTNASSFGTFISETITFNVCVCNEI